MNNGEGNGGRMAGEEELQARLGGMSLSRKIGQMLLCGFYGTEIGDGLKRFIAERGIGGVIYFARNVSSVEQVAELSARLQETALHSGNLPLWISIDQEGGMVARITDGVALMPGQMAIAAGSAPEEAYRLARISGEELRLLGINLNFAPVLDVNNNPGNPVIGVRSFGESPERAAEYGLQTLRGLQDAGVAATAKHFPGHGDTETDSHLDLPVVPHERERMDRVELIPFRQAIAGGVDAIMSAHIRFPALEPERLPVTLSRTVLTGLLREEMGFEGAIITDCMEMNAISEYYGTVEAAVMAVEAGADMVLISHREELQASAMDAIEQAVRDGRITEQRIDESVIRLLRLKAKRGLFGNGSESGSGNAAGAEAGAGASTAAVRGAPALVPPEVGCAAHLDAAREASERSITLVRNEAGVLPLMRERTLAVTVMPAAVTQADERYRDMQSLGAALAGCGLEVVDRPVGLTDVEPALDGLLADASPEQVKQIVIGTYNARMDNSQQELVRRLSGLGKPVAVVALRNPYDLLTFPEVSAYAAAYECRPLSLQSAAKALMGQIPFRGRLPVSLGEEYPAGWGLVAE